MTKRKNIEDEHVESGDIHNLVKREVRTQLRSFYIASFSGEERIVKKVESLEDAFMASGPRRFVMILDNVATKAAILFAFFFHLFKR